MDNPASLYNRNIFHALTMQAIADTKIADMKNGIQTPGYYVGVCPLYYHKPGYSAGWFLTHTHTHTHTHTPPAFCEKQTRKKINNRT